MRRNEISVFLLVLAMSIALPGPATAQTASAGMIGGTVTDPSGGVVPSANVSLLNIGTNAAASVLTNTQGAYRFPNLPPGNYSITVEAAGFQKSIVKDVTVQVATGTTANVTLQVGAANQSIEVTETARAQLETAGSQVGNVLNQSDLESLPTLQHNAGELVSIQPGVTISPGSGGVRVTGALDDQNTITLNGIDITDNVMLSNSNGLRTMVPIPTDAMQEFRVGVSNVDSSYGRGSGAQVALAARQGSNAWHGAAYWYTQNSVLNANTWDNNRLRIAKPSLRDNRAGGRLGGPLIKDKTFFFLNYEGRRFPQQLPFSRVVPSDTLRQGVLRFRDASGNIVSYNLANASLCGPTGNQLCDPRQLGISPTMTSMWSLMPHGNNTSLGDGLNTIGYTSNLAAPLTEDFYMARLDHALNSKWQFSGLFIYDHSGSYDAAQVDLSSSSGPRSDSFSPTRSNFVSGSLTGQLTPTLINTFRFGYVRDRNGIIRGDPAAASALLKLPGTGTAAGPVAISTTNGSGGTSSTGGLIDEPIDVFTQSARTQVNDNRDIQFIDDLVKVKGNHTLDAGLQLRYLPSFHQRNDQTYGSLTALTATLDADVTASISIPGADRPPTCAAGIQTNCILSANVQTWDRLYANVLGLVDNVGVLAARDGSLKALPLGTPLVNDTRQWAPYFYAMDTWRVRPSLTLTVGLSYGWQQAPTEKLGRQTIEIDQATGQRIAAPQYLQSRIQAAQSGTIYNPTFAFLPVNTAHLPIFDTDWKDLAPRFGFAYNPTFDSGFLNRLLGNRATVVRGGWGIYYDRVNTVQSVVIPLLGGVGFGQQLSVLGPTCAASGSPGAGCNASPSSPNPALSAFRVGQDGAIPIPAVQQQLTPPVIPAVPFGSMRSVMDDPNFTAARSYNADVTIQRQLPGRTVLEAGWAGRWGRHLPEEVNLDQAPYFMVDSASKQTFAQAFDSVATALRSGKAVTPQPWFENLVPKITGTSACPATAASNTQCLASNLSSAFLSGLVSNIFSSIDTYRLAAGQPVIVNRQTQTAQVRTYIGHSVYQGLLLSLRKQTSFGLSFDLNYTRSKSLDNGVYNQGSSSFFPNSFYPDSSYGPSGFDQTNVWNARLRYSLPAGRGHLFHFGNALDNVVGGWYLSGIFSAYGGLPLTVTESAQVWGSGLLASQNGAAIPTANLSTGLHSSISGSSNTGTTGNPATGGSGLNLFSDPAAAFNSFRPVLLSQDGRDGRANPIRGLGFRNLDTSLGKEIPIHERLKAVFAFYFFNLLNHPNFSTPSLSLTSPQSFGVVTSTLVPANRPASSRWIEFTFRVEF